MPHVINSLDLFVSSKDIQAGTRWQTEIASQLEATKFGIVCVTADNQASRWLNFEAGALAKTLESSLLVPLAIDLKQTDIEPPLGQFQGQAADFEGVRAIMRSINASLESTRRPVEELDEAMELLWPKLGQRLADIAADPALSGRVAPERSDRQLLEEVVTTVRSISRVTASSGRAAVRGDPFSSFQAIAKELARELVPYGGVSATPVGRRAMQITTEKEVPPDALERIVDWALATYGVELAYVGQFPQGTRYVVHDSSEGLDEQDMVELTTT
jgi:hypothetical protein